MIKVFMWKWVYMLFVNKYLKCVVILEMWLLICIFTSNTVTFTFKSHLINLCKSSSIFFLYELRCEYENFRRKLNTLMNSNYFYYYLLCPFRLFILLWRICIMNCSAGSSCFINNSFWVIYCRCFFFTMVCSNAFSSTVLELSLQ